MVLHHGVVEILHLPVYGHCFAMGIDFIYGCLVGAALVHGDLFWGTAGLHGFFKEPLGCTLDRPGR